MRHGHRNLGIAVVVLGAAWIIGAQAWVDSGSGSASLKVGDPAPPLAVSRWLKGDPVEKFETGKIYVVEFWATWCPPCRLTIPHLSRLDQQYRDRGVVIIGQNTGDPDEKRVEKFIESMGTNMTYRVALEEKTDEGQGRMAQAWLEAAGQSGIPCAFVVDRSGRIAWVGHPLAGLDKVIEQLLAGTFNAQKTAAEQAQRRQLSQRLARALAQKEWDTALEILEEMVPLTDPQDRSGISVMRFQILVRKGDAEEAGKIATGLCEAHGDRADLLNELAWTLATAPSLGKRDLQLIEKIARKANEAAKGEEPAILDTLARALFMKGDPKEAIRLQQAAVEKARNEKLRADLAKTLESYKKGVLPPVEAESPED